MPNVTKSPWIMHYDGTSCNGGVFKDCYNVLGGVDKVIPVDIYVPGCAARPESIIDGVVQSLALLQEKSERRKEAAE